ncbi:hypothetical protein [Sorangium cellulosum]|uniref:hypothetical protein n=1 Tax=Sorangium cellulosum TaxID=56 RepID=UPI001F236559|nr:hypothetical protein [Sorangium cellulosum]
MKVRSGPRRRRTIVAAVVAVPALGAVGAGCLWEREEHAPGRFCAQSNTSVVEHCVDASEGPGSAWSTAEEDGELPIQMWAVEPSGAMLDDLAANAAALRAWFDNIERAVAYVRDEQKNAESLRATLHGRLLGLLLQSRQRQEAILKEEPVRAADNFQQAMTDKASAEEEPLVAALAADKQAMAVVQAIFEQARSDAAPLQSRYAGVAARFAAYRATEAVETAAYAALSKQASRSDIDGLDGAEQAVLAAAREASRAPNELATEIMTLSAELQALAVSSGEAIAPHEEVLATHGAVVPDMTSGALRSLSAMLGYAQRRVARSDATATALLGGIALRRQALGVLEGDEGAREAIARSRIKRASEVFGERESARGWRRCRQRRRSARSWGCRCSPNGAGCSWRSCRCGRSARRQGRRGARPGARRCEGGSMPRRRSSGRACRGRSRRGWRRCGRRRCPRRRSTRCRRGWTRAT